ncbi:iron-sulfur cluster assembly accessory protein [Kineococcus esterisolvens]|uniref:hypothetical protein n=1 Tax=unclassified Kineococcus TaxID=2621656 RepID=UPI003D7D9C2A
MTAVQVKPMTKTERDAAEASRVALAEAQRTQAENTAAITSAEQEAERRRRQTHALAQAVQRAEQAVINTATEVAEAVAPTIGDAAGLPVTVTAMRPKSAPARLPHLYVVQTTPTDRDLIDGRIAGGVEVLLYRSSRDGALNGDRVSAMLETEGVRLNARQVSNREVAGASMDVLPLEIRIAHEPVPQIRRAADDAWRWGQLQSDIRNGLTAQFGSAMDRPVGVRIGAGDASALTSTVTGLVSKPRQISDTTDAEGLRRRVAELSVGAGASSPHCPWSADDLARGVVKVVNNLADTCHGGLGRVEAVEVTEVQPMEGTPRGRACRARATLVSREPLAQ